METPAIRQNNPISMDRIKRRMRISSVKFAIVSFVCMVVMLTAFDLAAKDIDLTQISLEELMDVRIRPVTSASKYRQKSFDAPSSISIVTSEEITEFGYRTIGELLQSVRGFYITNDRNYSYGGFRGMNRPGDYSTRILLLLDGVRVNDNVYDSAPLGMDFILDVDLIKRVEIVRGPSYALYGNNAFFTVVNVITKDAEDLGVVEVSVDAGGYDTYKGRLSSGKVFKNGAQMIVSGSLLDSNGQSLYYPEFDSPDQNNGRAVGCDGERSGSLFFKYVFDDITFTSGYVKRSKQIPTAPWEIVFNDPENKSWDERAFADIKINRGINAHLDFTARLTCGLYTYDGDYVYYDDVADENYLNKDEQKGEWWGLDVHFVRKSDRHTFIAGGEYRDNFTLNQKNYDAGSDVYLDDHQNAQNWALFAQDEYQLLSNLNIHAGLRYDHFSTFGDTINPRVAFVFRPHRTTAIKYLAGTAFRAPNAYELYYNDGDFAQKANPDLDNERITSHEVVWEQIFGKYYLYSASLYYFKISDLISQTTDPDDDLLVFLNSDEVEAKGFETGISATYPNNIKFDFSYAFQESKCCNKSAVWTNSPKHLAKLNFSVPLISEKLILGIEEQYTGKLKTLTRASTGNYFITNLTLSGKDIINNMDISASVYNLFDRTYGVPGSDEHHQDVIEQDGMSFRIKATCCF